MTYEAHEGYRLSCECEICCAKRAQEPDHFAKYHPRSAAELFRAIDAEMTARTIDVPQAPELCSSCHRSECEPRHSCFAAFVAALPEPCACCFESPCADPQACADELEYALEYVGAPVSDGCPTPGDCKCLVDHNSPPSPALVAKPGLRPCPDKKLAAGFFEVLPCACTGDE